MVDLIFHQKHKLKLHEHTIKFHSQNHPSLSGLLLLAAFPNPMQWRALQMGLGP